MNPKDGKAGSAVSPAKPRAAEDADVADPGKMAELKSEQRQARKGKYNPVKTQPHHAGKDAKSGGGDEESGEEKKSWIEIELIDDEKRPVPGARYSITLPDETVAEGTLDEKGFARVEGISPGNCKITFPDYDQSCWKPVGGGGGGKSGGAGGGGKSGSGGSASKGSGSQDAKSGGADAGSSSSKSGGDPGFKSI